MMMNTMNGDMYNMLSTFLVLTAEEKIAVLTRVAFELTIFARNTYLPDSDGLKHPEQLRIYNEIQHKLLGQLNKILTGDENRYPDDLFLQMLLEMAEPAEGLTKLPNTFEELITMQPFFGCLISPATKSPDTRFPKTAKPTIPGVLLASRKSGLSV